jgi:hypothetical protein
LLRRWFARFSATHTIMPSQCWQIENSSARLKLARLSARVNPLDPAAGVGDVSVDGRPLLGLAPLAVDLPRVESQHAASNVEVYVRGGDLVATYADRPEPQMRTQIYWRAATHDLQQAVAAVELVASVQTNLLDSCPKLSTHSRIDASEVFQLTDPEQGTFAPLNPRPARAETRGQAERGSCYLFRLAGGSFSYVEIVHPAEAQHSSCDATNNPGTSCALRHRLFAERLEKGVILRARVLGVLMDRSGDQAAAARHYASFLSAELPLTT